MNILINIDVPALAPAIGFYCAALGLAHRRTIDGDVAELTGASSTIYLLAKGADTQPVHGSPGSRDYRRHWTPVHFDLVVDDLDSAAARAIAAGAVQESSHVLFQGSDCLSFADPFGHGFCLIQFQHGGTYQS